MVADSRPDSQSIRRTHLSAIEASGGNMKITGVRSHLYQFEMTRLLGDANSPQGWKGATHLAVFLDTDEGITGVSLGSGSARRHIHSFVDRFLVGRDPRGVRGLWQRMADAVFKVNNRGIVNDALSTLDVALWDLKAKINGEPLWKTLGASTRRVRAYASGLDMPLSDDEMRAFYTDMAAKGIFAGKLKIGLDPEADLRRIGIMRDALATSGKKPALMVDVNE
jgi:L-alanine-DL-glutamate epimerase-like enolase superfamily enzyme